ncbi:hypothetical protein CPAR01_03026 [Colletotrichum paranaense]|uniref:Uncharacterized protein n=1 Tax=Colletotrichum paranaense TaxID=1914294 RepID=A0ABQ9T165_9PEZI|nr:uncharacterized protein CPAR01_03026 [Colletotrichum paranaense]KAK1545524.1 hypothetical protein CPAR01_03026 [Colletotrichum paranaense]
MGEFQIPMGAFFFSSARLRGGEETLILLLFISAPPQEQEERAQRMEIERAPEPAKLPRCWQGPPERRSVRSTALPTYTAQEIAPPPRGSQGFWGLFVRLPGGTVACQGN